MPRLRTVVLAGTVGMLAGLPAIAATETVRVAKATDDKTIITRRNGESYLIEKGTGCMSLWRYEGKQVLIISPGLFLGVGSMLVIPELDQECRVWNSKLLSGPVAPPPRGLQRPSCEEGHWITSVSGDGEIVKLEDGSIWEVNVIDRIHTTLWLPTEQITICGDRLINKDTGDAAEATRVK